MRRRDRRDRRDRRVKIKVEANMVQLIRPIDTNEVTCGDVFFPSAKSNKNKRAGRDQISFFVSASKFAANVTDDIG